MTFVKINSFAYAKMRLYHMSIVFSIWRENMNAILQTKKLSKSFSNGGIQQHVLKNVDMEIYEKDFTVIMGASGSGKSTLLYAISGMDKPSLGTVTYKNGKELNITDLSHDGLAEFRSKNCGFIFQQIYLVDSMSILDNVLLSGLLGSKDKKSVVEKAKNLLISVGIDERMFGKFPSQISGGEAQRVGMVRAVINAPAVLFADEPTGALNSHNSKAVLDVLMKLNNQGQSIILVTHDILSAMRANRILYLKDGQIIGELKLERFIPENESRKKTIKDFLAGFGW